MNVTMNKSFLILSLFVSLLACQSKKSTNETPTQKEILISLDEDRCYDMSKFLSYHSFVVLESNDESVIGEINKIQLSDNYILVLDKTQGTLFMFDSQGTYINKLARKGRGHGEYMNADDFYYDAQTDHIYMYDGLSGKVVEYDMQANYIAHYPISKGQNMIKVVSSGDWLLYRGNGAADFSKNKSYNNLVVYNSAWKVIKEDLPFNKYLLGRRYDVGSMEPIFSYYYGKIYILPSMSDKVYAYNCGNRSMETAYLIHFKGYEKQVIDEHMEEKPLRELISKIYQFEYPGYINHFHKDGELLSFTFNYKDNKGSLMCFYNELTGETKVCDCTLDENGLFVFPASYWCEAENKLVLGVVEGLSFKRSRRKNPDNPVLRAISEKAGEVGEMNPVLVFYTIN